MGPLKILVHFLRFALQSYIMRAFKLSAVLAFLVIFQSGCINIIEELFLSKDGTGQYMITMDASQIMEGGGLRSMIQMMGSEAENIPFDMDQKLEMDSTINMASLPESEKANFNFPELLNRVNIQTQISESKELMITKFILDFKETQEIDQFRSDLSNLSNQSGGGMPGLGLGGMFGETVNNLPLYITSKKTLSRSKTKEASSEPLDDQNLQMMEMMMNGANYTLKIHCPGDMKKSTFTNATHNGKDLILEGDLLEVIKGKSDFSGSLKFKKR